MKKVTLVEYFILAFKAGAASVSRTVWAGETLEHCELVATCPEEVRLCSFLNNYEHVFSITAHQLRISLVDAAERVNYSTVFNTASREEVEVRLRSGGFYNIINLYYYDESLQDQTSTKAKYVDKRFESTAKAYAEMAKANTADIDFARFLPIQKKPEFRVETTSTVQPSEQQAEAATHVVAEAPEL